MPPSGLELFFNPRGIAVLGASQDPVKLGYGLSRNLVQSGYTGAIHFVNPRGGKMLGRPIYPSMAEVPDPVDLAVLLIPAPAVPQGLRECAARGVQAAIIASGGFRETGPAGAMLEQECLDIARQHGIRLIGPNCIGLLDTHLPLDTTFLSPPGPTPGDVAFISHSGAICAAVIDWARGQGFGISRLVSLGNQADVNETDMLTPTAADPYTKVLTLYLEGVSNGRRFVELAGQVTRSKPVIALKVGRFKSGQRAVASHTGALAGQETAFNAAFRRCGVIRAETSEELFDWARVLAWCPLPQGRRVAVLTNSGGPGVTAADAIEAQGLRLAELLPETRQALTAELIPGASLNNPIDMLASATPQQYANCLRVLLADPGVDSVMVILPPPPMHTAGGVAKAMIPVIYTAEKPVVVALMGERLIQEAVEYFRAAHVPEYRFPERAASALAILAKRAEYLQEVAENKPAAAPTQCCPDQVRAILASLPAGTQSADGFLPSEAVFRILEAYGIRTLRPRRAGTAAAAVAAARELGFPVALKIASPDIVHKSEVGGLALNLNDEAAVQAAFGELLERVAARAAQARLEGVDVQKMLPKGQEVIVGTVQDAQFGALVMFGSGGVEVEGLKDVQFSLAPLVAGEADGLLQNTWAGVKLKGFRGGGPADQEAVRQTLERMAGLAADFPELQEFEINPLIVLEAGQGAWAVDARARLASKPS